MTNWEVVTEQIITVSIKIQGHKEKDASIAEKDKFPACFLQLVINKLF